jgi:hypothetical protein
MVLEAGYPNTSGFRKVVKATILVKKKAGMSMDRRSGASSLTTIVTILAGDEAFIEHYNHKHAQMAAPVLEKHNVITYSLVRQACLFRPSPWLMLAQSAS